MDLSAAKRFIKKISGICTIDALTAMAGAFFQELGFQYFSCVSHVDLEYLPIDAVGMTTYPETWADHYIHSHLEKTDPVQRYIHLTLLPFSWNDPAFLATLSPDQKELMNDAKSFGIAHGYTIPLHPPGHVTASLSVCPGNLSPRPGSHMVVQIVAPFIFEEARRIVRGAPLELKDETRLTPRQLQCLELAALGKSDWVIGEILGISERTVHHHLESAKKRLGVATRAQAIVEALREAQISMADLQPGRYSHN